MGDGEVPVGGGEDDEFGVCGGAAAVDVGGEGVDGGGEGAGEHGVLEVERWVVGGLRGGCGGFGA